MITTERTKHSAKLTAIVELDPPVTDSVAVAEALAEAHTDMVDTALFGAWALGQHEGTMHIYRECGPAHEKMVVRLDEWEDYNVNVDQYICKVKYRVENLRFLADKV